MSDWTPPEAQSWTPPEAKAWTPPEASKASFTPPEAVLPPARLAKANAFIAGGRRAMSIGEPSMNVDAANRVAAQDNTPLQNFSAGAYKGVANVASGAMELASQIAPDGRQDLRDLAQSNRQAAQDVPAAPGLAQTAGQFVGPALLTGPAVMTGAAAPIAMAVTGAFQGAGSAANQAAELQQPGHEVSGHDKAMAELGHAIVGAVAGYFGGKALPLGGAGVPAKIAANVVAGGGIGAASNLAENAIAKGTIDPNRAWTEGLKESAIGGGVQQGIFSGVHEGFNALKGGAVVGQSHASGESKTTSTPVIEPEMPVPSIGAAHPTESVREASGTEKLSGREDRQTGVAGQDSRTSVQTQGIPQIQRGNESPLGSPETTGQQAQASSRDLPADQQRASLDQTPNTPDSSSSVSSLPSPEPSKPADLSKTKEPWQMTQKEFYKKFQYQHSLLREDTPEIRQSIESSGFTTGIGPNATSITERPPADIMEKKYGTRSGRRVYALPEEAINQSGNGAKVKGGYKPSPSHTALPIRDFEPVHEAIVREAISRGEDVPAKVLAQYPNLKPAALGQGESAIQGKRTSSGYDKAESMVSEMLDGTHSGVLTRGERANVSSMWNHLKRQLENNPFGLSDSPILKEAMEIISDTYQKADARLSGRPVARMGEESINSPTDASAAQRPANAEPIKIDRPVPGDYVTVRTTNGGEVTGTVFHDIGWGTLVLRTESGQNREIPMGRVRDFLAAKDPRTEQNQTGETKSIQGGAPAPTAEAGDIGVGPAGINDPAFTKKEPGAPTGIKNAAMEVERAVHGHPSATPTEPRPHEALKASVEQEIKENPSIGSDLVDELDKHPRPTDDRENFILSHRQNELNRLYEKTVNDLIVANDSGDDHARVTAEIQESFLSDKLLQLADVAKVTGAKWGQSGASRQRLFNEDFSLASLVKRKRAASGGRELTQEEITTRKTLADKIKASEEKVNENEQTGSTRRRKVNTEKALTEIDAKMKDQVVKEKAAGRKRDLPAEQASILKGLKEHAEAKDPPEKLGSYIERLYKNFRAGGLERNDALDATHAEVKKLMPEMNRDDTMDAISGFEKFKRLSGGELQAKIRQEKQEFQSLGKLRNLFQNKLFGKTGAERQSPSDIKRGLEKRVYDELKARNLKVTDPVKQAKSALDAMKTRLKNRMADLRLEMSTGQKFARDKTKVQLDEEATNLKTEYDEVKKQHDDIFGTPGLTDQQRLKIATAAAQRSEAMWKERADNARKGIFDVSKQPGRKMTSQELEAINARRDAHHEEVDLLKSLDTTTSESAKEKSLQDSITKLKQRIATGDIDPKTGRPTVDTKRVSDLKVEQAGLEKQIRDLQNAKIPKKSPEEIALQSYKTRKAHSIADLADRIANQDFAVKHRQPIALDTEGLRLKAEHERLKNIERTDLLKDRMSRRTPAEKAQDTFVKWRRGFLFSSPGILTKLTGAASFRLAANPVEEAIGAGIGKAFPGLQSRATREGRSSVRIEAKALAEGMTTGMKDAWQVLKTGKSDLDTVFGKNRGDMPRSVIDFFGNIHGALKAPVKRAAFARSVEIGMERATSLGLDPSEPLVQARIALDGYKEGQRDIFQNDNRVTNAANRAINALREPDKLTGRVPVGGKAMATIADTLLPVKNVPTNIVGEAIQYATGSVTGSVKLGMAYRRGIENLAPHEADAIMRSLRKGSIGAAVLALGYFGANAVGGYYQPGKKRDEADVPAGGARVFGEDVPSSLLHHPLMEALQVGATARRVAESKQRKSDPETQGITAGSIAAALGLIEEVPFAREAVEVGKIFDPASRNSALGKTAESIAVPKVVSDLTAAADSKDRKPTGFIQNIEAGVPGLRGNVPAVEPKDPRLVEKSKATEEKNTRRDALDPAIQSLLSEHSKIEQIPPLKRTQQERQRHAQLSALARTYQSYQKATTDEARNRFADQLKQNAGRISGK